LKYDSFHRCGVKRAFKTMLDDEPVAVLTCCDEQGGDLFVHREFPVYPGILPRPAIVHIHSFSKARSDIGKNAEVIRDGSGIPSESEDWRNSAFTQSRVNRFSWWALPYANDGHGKAEDQQNNEGTGEEDEYPENKAAANEELHPGEGRAKGSGSIW